MSKIKAQLFLSIGLMVFCAQVLALPFLNCCIEDEGKEEQHSHMANVSQDHHTSIEHDKSLPVISADTLHEKHNMNITADHACTICITLGSAVSIEHFVYQQSFISFHPGESINNWLISTPQESLFKPPRPV